MTIYYDVSGDIEQIMDYANVLAISALQPLQCSVCSRLYYIQSNATKAVANCCQVELEYSNLIQKSITLPPFKIIPVAVVVKGNEQMVLGAYDQKQLKFKSTILGSKNIFYKEATTQLLAQLKANYQCVSGSYQIFCLICDIELAKKLVALSFDQVPELLKTVIVAVSEVNGVMREMMDIAELLTND
ncbi:Hypothetical_protein [Hexamita inflata]|uniref:Hypothetical_protein n=1 Tax=Hexamita inflata TaxID=28002 RepID=A0AA86RD16_9EUKA|nr:Hypothetical protein HINF_LOCUS60013 [Hexamita inflata]